MMIVLLDDKVSLGIDVDRCLYGIDHVVTLRREALRQECRKCILAL